MNAKKNARMGDAAAAATETDVPVVVMPDEFNQPAPKAVPLDETQRQTIPETDTSAEAQADTDAELDISQEERDELNRLAGEVLKQEPAPTPQQPIDGPVALLGKTQGDAAAAAHAAGTAETKLPAEPAVPVARIFDFPADFKPLDHGYTAAQVLEAAIDAHQANKAYCESIGDMSQKDWEQSPDWQCKSAIQGVCFAIANGFPSPEAMHNNWMKEKVSAGWKWGPVKNPDIKEHPCIVPYAYLPEPQRRKDDIFRETVMAALGPRAPTEKEVEEAKPRTDHLDERGQPVYLEEFSSCLFLALGPRGGRDKPEQLELIPFELAMFFRNEPSAPEAAGLMHLKLKLKIILLPNEDPRRVELALKLFRIAINSVDVIEKEDGEKARLAAEAANAPKPAKIPEGEGTFDKDDDSSTRSDIGKALDKRGQ